MKTKRIFAVLLAAVMALGMTSCSQSGDSSSTSGSTEGEVVLKIPTFFVGENVGAVYFEPAVERFNEANSGTYRIELEEVVEDTYTDKLAQLAQSNQLPTVFSTPGTDWVKTVIIPNELYYDTTDWLKESGIIDLAIDSSIEYSTMENGTTVGIPIVTVSTMGLYYNTELYNPDKAISQMSVDEYLESFTGNTMAFQTVDNAWTSMLFLTSLIANEAGGTELLQQYDGDKLYDYNQEPIINAVTKLKSLWSEYAASNAVGAAYADAANIFMSNGAAVIYNGTWMNAEFGADSTDKWSAGFDGANVKADYYPGDIAICNTAGFGRWMISNNYANEDELNAAKAFMEFIYSPDELEAFSLIEGCQIPNLETSADYATALAADPLVSAQATLLTDTTTIVPSLASIMPDSVANDVFANMLVQLVNDAITPEQFCQSLTTKSEESKNA